MQVHAELYSVLPKTVIPSIMSKVVDMVTEEINRLVFSITKFNKSGALQVSVTL